MFKNFDRTTTATKSILNKLNHLLPVLNDIVISYVDTTMRFITTGINKEVHMSVDNTRLSPNGLDIVDVKLTNQLNVGESMMFKFTYNEGESMKYFPLCVWFDIGGNCRLAFQSCPQLVDTVLSTGIMRFWDHRLYEGWLHLVAIQFRLDFDILYITGYTCNHNKLWEVKKLWQRDSLPTIGLTALRTNIIQHIDLLHSG